MLPEDRLSQKAIVTGYPYPVKRPGDFLVDWERGGIALNDMSKGLDYQLWKLDVVQDKDDTSLFHFNVSAPSVPTITLFSEPNIKSASLAFDQSMNPFVVFMQGSQARIYWYDSSVGAQIISNLQAGISSPVCCIDDHRTFNISASDIVLAYIRAGWLRVRYQRERYTVEHDMCEVGAGAELLSVGMNSVMRVQFHIRNVSSALTDGRFRVFTSPILADIVFDLNRRAGISDECINVNELYDDIVPGYLVTRDAPIADALSPLSKAFMFDIAEYERKINYVKRGRDVSFNFTHQDLLEADDPFKTIIVDETKLPVEITVTHQDPQGGLAKNSQISRRRSNVVKAKGKEKLEFDFGLEADQAATIALKYIKMKWHEQTEYSTSLGIAFSHITCGDVGYYTDEDGTQYRLRCKTRNEADGKIKFEFSTDGGVVVYNRGTTGNSLPPPTSTTPGLVGETRVEILNIPPLRDQDDELGVYIAMAGESSAWYGAALNISTDGGINFVEAMQAEVPATLGDTETQLEEEVSAEYPSKQTLVVKVNYDLESVSEEVLLTNYNRAVLGDEIIQFQTATHLGNQRYLLSGLIRGRYNTKPEQWPAGTRFVLLDTSLTFVRAQQWMLGMELTFQAVSFGQNEDDSVPLAYDFDVAYSQKEWAPGYLTTLRTGSSVVIDWVGRGRLGVETAPRNGQYFTGYRVKFSDGFTVDVGDVQTYTRASTPVGATVQVCALNSITGEGDYSEAVST